MKHLPFTIVLSSLLIALSSDLHSASRTLTPCMQYPQSSVASELASGYRFVELKHHPRYVNKLDRHRLKKHSKRENGKKGLAYLLLALSPAAFAFGIIALFGGAFGAPLFIGIGIAVLLGAVALGALAFKLLRPAMKPWKRWLWSLAVNAGLGLLYLAALQLLGG